LQKLYVTWDQFTKIKYLSWDCERHDGFDENLWIRGLESICGKDVIDKLEKYKPTEVIARNENGNVY
jgi:hypothetical protein